MKKAISLVLTALLSIMFFAACSGTGSAGGSSGTGNTGNNSAPSAGGSSAPSAEAGFDANRDINAITREEGSGTRGAFVELTGVEEKDASGNKVDNTSVEAAVAGKTAVVLTMVAGDPFGIGYISLGSLDNTVKAVSVDGVAPTAENVSNGSYAIARPFNVVKSASASEATQDFLDYILSAEGQQIVADNGYIPNKDAGDFKGGSVSGKIVVAGSSSVTPVMEKLKEAYAALNSKAEIEIQESDSTTGMQTAIDGTCDIGMASRELKDSEKEAGLEAVVIAMDGIAVIVNNANTTTALTMEQIKGIFTGEITAWNEIA